MNNLSRSRLLLLAVALALSALVEGCSGSEPTVGDSTDTGSVGLALQQANGLSLVATAVATNTQNTTTAVIHVPTNVRPDDFAIVFVLSSGNATLASSPPGFTTSNLAASNHRLSYGPVGDAGTLTWKVSPAATTGATAYFLRGKQISVRTVSSKSTTSASYGTAATVESVPPGSLGYGFFGLQLGLTNPPSVASGPGGAWVGPLTDGKQLITFAQSLGQSESGSFSFPASSGTLSASATFRSAQVLVQAPAWLNEGSGGASGTGGAAGSSGSGAGGASGRPNILLIIADDLGAEATSVYPELAGSSGAVPAPNLEALAAGGLVFDNVWASPVCSPTRGTIVSGLYGHHTGVTTVGSVLPTSTVTLFDRITAESPAAYDSVVFGKYHLGTTLQHVRDLGIPRFRGFLAGAIDNYYDWTAVDISGPSTHYTTYSTTVLTDLAVQFIANHRAVRPNDPWFVYQAYNSPHFPNQVPPANLHSVDLGNLQPGAVSDSVLNYKAMIQSLDTEIGRLLASVDFETTTVIFIGDNGTPANVKDPGARVRGSKSSVYEGGVRVPLIIRGAGVSRRGREGALVVSSDLYATILSLAGVPVSHVNDSYSLTPLLTAPAVTTGRTHSFSEMCNGASQRLYAIKDTRYKLLSSNGQRALYDLETDPLETTNLYASTAYASIRAGLEAEVATLKAHATAGCFQ